MKYALLFLFAFSTSPHLLAQVPAEWYPGPNLIPNPGFEKLRRSLPQYDLDGSVAFRNSLDSWMSPNNGTPDLMFFVNGGYELFDGPHQGNAMVAILTHNPESKRSDTYREYIQAKLDKPLIEGAEYYLEFWVCRSKNSKMTSNNVGVAFSPVPTLNRDWIPLTEMQPILNVDTIINPERSEWVKISTKFTAYNRDRFILIGNFFDNEMTTFGETPDPGDNKFTNAYYLLDDIGLYQLNVRPEPEASLADRQVEVGEVIRLDRVYFDFDKWDLLPASFEELDELLTLLQKYPGMKIAIHGHTDSRGTDAYNVTLSDNRARSVYDYLANNGVALDRIESEGFGEGRPIRTNDTDEGRQYNRRVEFVVLELGEENVSVENVVDEEQYEP
ncbi:MAG: OmpA family protein [Bacteroidota bacterium]